MPERMRTEAGVMLIEAMVGLLIFAAGILALVAMQATAVRTAQDARYRTEAVNYAADLLSRMMVSVDRSTEASLQGSLVQFEHQPGGANCAFSGAVSASPMVANWVNVVAGSGGTSQGRAPLPGTTAQMLQVLVDTTAGSYNQVSITVCWRAPDDPAPRRHTLISYVT